MPPSRSRARDVLGRPFALLFTASTASNLGDGMLLAAVPLLARDLTTDPLGVAAVTIAATAPWLVFGLVAGTIVDRHDRQATMVAVDLARAAGLAVVAVAVAADVVTLPLLVVAMFALGLGETLFDTAAQAMLPRVVRPDQLERANGRLFGAQLAANGFVGPPVGAVLFAAVAFLPLAVDAVTFAVSAALVAGLPRPAPEPGHGAGRAGRGRLVADIREGLTWLWGHRGVRAFAVGAAVVNVAHTAVMAVTVLLVRDVLGAGPTGFGLTLTAAAIGGIAGTQLAPWAVARAGRRVAVVAAVAAFSVSLIVAGTASHVAVVAAGLAGFGAAGEVWNVVAVSYRQALVPDRLLGRVMATYRFLAYGAMPVGAALGGVVARLWGVRATFVAGAGLVLGLLAYFVPATRGEDFSPGPAPGGE